MLTPRSCATKLLGSNPGWWKPGGHVSGFKYVSDVDIRYPGTNRTFYFLVYGTREPPGIAVFRDCQIKALEAQSMISGQRSLQKRETAGQGSLFDSSWETAPVTHRQFLDDQREAAKISLMDIASAEAGIQWGKVWPRLLADHAIRKKDAGSMAAALRKSGAIAFRGWEPNKRIPADGYELHRN